MDHLPFKLNLDHPKKNDFCEYRWKKYLKSNKTGEFVYEILKNMENITLWNLQILYVFVLRAEKLNHIRRNWREVVGFSARNGNIHENCNFRKCISVFYNISQPNLAIFLLILRCSFERYW